MKEETLELLQPGKLISFSPPTNILCERTICKFHEEDNCCQFKEIIIDVNGNCSKQDTDIES
ncbi:MAG: hypothetical protein ABFC98_05735 [Candidatus Cloacimonas sp.]